ncbi:MAG: hypothetical protein R3C16_09855 [Hyphomonadaceae bacterium]
MLNQIAVRCGTDLDAAKADALTQRTIERVQREGECFIGGAQWRGARIIRISVISEGTTEEDADRSVDAIVRAWRTERQAG